MKEAGYLIFGILYSLFKWLPVRKNTAFLIMTHDSGPEGNVAVTGAYMKEHYGTKLTRLTREDTSFGGPGGLKRAFIFFFVKAWKMAGAEYIFLDNAFLPMSRLKVRKGTTVVQLWHGTGTIKKFGQHVNTGQLYEEEKKAGENLDYVIVSSEATREIYAGCFSVDPSQVKILGLPRTDLLFDQEEIRKRRKAFLEEYPDLKEKKLILYAPTFRDQEVEHPGVHMDLKKMAEELPEDCCLGLRLHPFVAERFKLEEDFRGKILDFSSYRNLNTLLMATDLLISDYSSIVFEYSVFERPMIFYAYDLAEFSDHGRGFYRDYRTYVPGPVAETTEEILSLIKAGNWDREKIHEFVKDSYAYTDGKSTERLVNFVRGQKTDDL